MALLTLADPFWTGLQEVLHTPGLPYVSDFTETEKILGVTATPVDEVLAEVLQRA
ncbi:hypothetical protein [Streptosporangium carneum]|uniref:Uncharacterized protein n=1 Tax=Streptosporangium carneum TaxID=47481 RepID=A0A9W6I8M8_9ACTN|nr:hypothetical protein [Streptosporangium carneum]GLK12979.1 hypothetical protein GCM10017600_63890 [Streptosporangium carneum]